MKYYLSEISDVLNELKSSTNGLSNEEAKKRLEKYGKNELECGRDLFWITVCGGSDHGKRDKDNWSFDKRR